jgi:hypothetical protein
MRDAMRVDAGLPTEHGDPSIGESDPLITKEQRCNETDA